MAASGNIYLQLYLQHMPGTTPFQSSSTDKTTRQRLVVVWGTIQSLSYDIVIWTIALLHRTLTIQAEKYIYKPDDPSTSCNISTELLFPYLLYHKSLHRLDVYVMDESKPLHCYSLFYRLYLPFRPQMPYEDTLVVRQEAIKTMELVKAKGLVDTETWTAFEQELNNLEKLCHAYEVTRSDRKLRFPGLRHRDMLRKSLECFDAAEKMRLHAWRTADDLMMAYLKASHTTEKATSSTYARPPPAPMGGRIINNINGNIINTGNITMGADPASSSFHYHCSIHQGGRSNQPNSSSWSTPGVVNSRVVSTSESHSVYVNGVLVHHSKKLRFPSTSSHIAADLQSGLTELFDDDEENDDNDDDNILSGVHGDNSAAAGSSKSSNTGSVKYPFARTNSNNSKSGVDVLPPYSASV